MRKDGYLIPASDSREDVEAHIRAATQALYHPAGTCAMGPGADAVVDSDLRVHGIDGLRVADASVMPNVIRGNTNAPAIMIGETRRRPHRPRTGPANAGRGPRLRRAPAEPQDHPPGAQRCRKRGDDSPARRT